MKCIKHLFKSYNEYNQLSVEYIELSATKA